MGGFEGVGTVVCSRSAAFPVGTRVGFIFRRFREDFGCWRNTVALSPERACIVQIPGSLALQEVAAGITSTLTAFACLRHFNAGSIIIVPGACGAVGLALLELAALRGMRAVGLLRGAERTSWIAKELGASGRVFAVD